MNTTGAAITVFLSDSKDHYMSQYLDQGLLYPIQESSLSSYNIFYIEYKH